VNVLLADKLAARAVTEEIRLKLLGFVGALLMIAVPKELLTADELEERLEAMILLVAEKVQVLENKTIYAASYLEV
jgi:predicted nucleic acid-binding protein